MKKIICLLPGLTDTPLLDLKGLTPLEKASTNSLDKLAKNGSVLTLSPPKDSLELSLLSLLNEDLVPNINKATLEALSLNKISNNSSCSTSNSTIKNEFKEAFSIIFASAEDGILVDVSPELLNNTEGRTLCKQLNEIIKNSYHFEHLQETKATLLSNKNRLKVDSYEINPISMLGQHWQNIMEEHNILSSELKKTMQKAMKFLEKNEINEIKSEFDEPIVNSLIITSAGKNTKRPITTKKQNYAFFTTNPTSIGLANIFEIDLINLNPEQKKYDYLKLIFEKLDEILTIKECFIIELPYIYKSTYKGNLLEKIKSIEWLDKKFIDPLTKYCQKNNYQLVISPLCNSDIKTGNFVDGNFPTIVYPTIKNIPSQSKFTESLIKTTPILEIQKFLSLINH